MPAYHVVGHLVRHSDGILEGWCSSPDLPGERLTVDILADDTPVASATADILRRDLACDGWGDGRHAFRLPPIAGNVAATVTLLSARERGTGRIFGRVRLRDAPPADPRLDAMLHEVGALRAALGAPAAAPAHGKRMRDAFAEAGARLMQPSAEPIGAACRMLARAVPRATGMPSRPPACSIIVYANDATRLAFKLREITPLLACGMVEIVIADAIPHSTAALLATLSPAITIVPAGVGASLTDAIGRAASGSRGGNLVLLDPACGAPAAAALAPATRRLAGGRTVIIGNRIAAAASRLGAFAQLAPVTSTQDESDRALLCLAPKGLFQRLGGLDPAFGDALDVAVVDFCLRAAMIGVETEWLVGPTATGLPAATMPSPAADAAFQARWRGLRP